MIGGIADGSIPQTVAAGAPAPKSNVPLPAASTATPGAGAAYLQAMNSANQSAEAQFMATMQSSGAWTQAQLSQIASWATGQITGQGQPNGLPVPYAQVALNFAQTPMFQQRFPGMAALEKQGLSITPAAYVAAESGYMAAATAAGLPSGTITPAEAGVLIGNNVSQIEFNQRISDAAVDAGTAAASNPDVVKALQAQGIGPGDLTSFFLNPEYTVNQINQKTQAGQIGGAAMAAGFNPLASATALGLAQEAGNPAGNLSQSQLNQQFSQESTLLHLSDQNASANALNTVDQGALAAQALGVATGAQARDITGALQARQGAASGGGGWATTQRGTGLGSASEQGAKGDQMGG